MLFSAALGKSQVFISNQFLMTLWKTKHIKKKIFTGISNTQIGKKLFISSHTVASHRKNIFKKSSCSSPASLFSYCRQRGL